MRNLHNDSESDINNDPAHPEENDTSKLTRNHFINDDNFKQLRTLQQEIYEISEMTPSIRKLVNALITNENISALKTKLIKEIND